MLYHFFHPKDKEEMYKIDQVSRMTGLSQKRIRDYDKEGLIKPVRDFNTNDRLFSEFDVRQIKRIKYLIHTRGFTIKSLKQLLRMAPGWNVFQCREKKDCEAFKNPHKRCWEIRKVGDKTHFHKFCSICPIYLARKVDKTKVFEKPNIFL